MSWITDCAVWEGLVIEPPLLPPVAGYAMWYDAADLATITATGADVTQWDDKSGNSFHLAVIAAVTGGASTSPETGTRTQNGLNVLDFNGTSDVLGRDTQHWYNFVTSTMFVVFQVDADPTDDGLGTLVYECVKGAVNPEYGLRYGTQHPSGVYVTNAGVVKAVATDTSVDITTGPTPHFVMMTDSGTAIKVATDGGTGTTVSSITRATTIPNSFAIGRLLGSGGPRGHNGWIAEVLIYPSVLSGGDIDLVEAYLIAKWGL